MADIRLRLGKDVLVLGTSIANRLCIDDAERDTALTLLVEPEVIEDAYALEALCGVQCAVAPTAQMTPARLAHTGLEGQAEVLARQAMEVVEAASYQHVLVEIGPCGLPLDVSSKASLIESRDQYASAVRLFEGSAPDAFFLNGFSRIADLKCALMGVAKASDTPVIASVDADANGVLVARRAHGVSVGEDVEEAAQAAAELGAIAFGFCTDAAPADALLLSARLSQASGLPKLVQLLVREEGGALAAPYADAIVDAACALRASGVQFLRACGAAPASYAGAIVAATEATEVVASDIVSPSAISADQNIDELAARLRQRVGDALGER